MSAAEPPMCTGMMQAVCSVIADFEHAGVDLERLRVGVDEDRQRVVHQDGVDRGDERIRRHDDLVARPDPQRGQRRDQGTRAVGDGHAVLGPQRPGPGLLEPVGIVAVDPAPLPLAEDLHPGRLVVLGDDRPRAERARPDRLAAQDGQRLVGAAVAAPLRQADRRGGGGQSHPGNSGANGACAWVNLAVWSRVIRTGRSDDLADRLGPFDADQLLVQAAVEVGQAVGVEPELVAGS